MRTIIKRLAAVLTVLCLAGSVMARERERSILNGEVYYYYDDVDEFYRYWTNTALAYNYAVIGKRPFSSNEFFASCSGDFGVNFSYYSGDEVLSVVFTDYPDGWGSYRVIPITQGVYGYGRALDYWNALISQM